MVSKTCPLAHLDCIGKESQELPAETWVLVAVGSECVQKKVQDLNEGDRIIVARGVPEASVTLDEVIPLIEATSERYRAAKDTLFETIAGTEEGTRRETRIPRMAYLIYNGLEQRLREEELLTCSLNETMISAQDQQGRMPRAIEDFAVHGVIQAIQSYNAQHAQPGAEHNPLEISEARIRKWFQ
ncbi:hypothetical protein COY95_04570, partial [Candidatus Woesearchaeota archaeon CG_4_10_14_0_8_um_filter_47_5]